MGRQKHRMITYEKEVREKRTIKRQQKRRKRESKKIRSNK
jgi:hypothetical protein